MEINGVEMIPSGLVTCILDGTEIGITELSPDAVRVRMAERKSRPSSMKVCFFHFEESCYEEVILTRWEIVEERQEAFYTIVTIVIEDQEYHKNALQMIKNYTNYVMLKMTGDDGYCSEELVGYPAQLDEVTASDFTTQKQQWFKPLDVGEWKTSLDTALVIDQPVQYQQYRKLGIKAFAKTRFEENHLSNHPITQTQIKRVYLGNQFCHNLFPKRVELLEMMDQARKEELSITVAMTYVREDQVAWAEALLEYLTAWCISNQQRIELVVNDWGMARLAADKREWIEPVLGVLLNKRRKDPRYKYKSGYTQYTDQLAKNSLNNASYREYLAKEFGIRRYEFESCGYPIQIPSEHQSIHVPYYQTNTSQYCTLYARCVNHDRGKQELVSTCPYYCEEAVFLYSEHLNMVGRYNSIFGMDDTLLRESERLDEYARQGIDRLVVTLL